MSPGPAKEAGLGPETERDKDKGDFGGVFVYKTKKKETTAPP